MEGDLVMYILLLGVLSANAGFSINVFYKGSELFLFFVNDKAIA